VWQVLKLEVDDDEDLETETLQMVLWDKDKVTADNVIGSVTCDLHPLLSRSASEIEGWFPVLDSLRGLCGQLRAVVKMTLLIDHNPREVTAAAIVLRSRSITRAQVNAGLMRLLTSPCLPEEERLQRIVGLVHHLACDIDPDSETKNSFRSGRSSNVQRMKVFQRLQGEARRGLCQRAAQLGANAVLSFAVNFDLEDNMIVARASGSAVLCKRVLHEDDTSSAASSKHSPLSSPRTKPYSGSRYSALLLLLARSLTPGKQPQLDPAASIGSHRRRGLRS
jgi:uncharacterized protein YbjQ (UPF0145 family)